MKVFCFLEKGIVAAGTDALGVKDRVTRRLGSVWRFWDLRILRFIILRASLTCLELCSFAAFCRLCLL